MKVNKAHLHSQHTTGDAKFQEESIRHQIAQQDVIIQNAARIIEKANSDQLLASRAKEFFLKQLPPDSHEKSNASSVGSSEKDSSEKAFLQLFSDRYEEEEGLGFNDIHDNFPTKVSRGTIFRLIAKCLDEGKIYQVNDSKKSRRFRIRLER